MDESFIFSKLNFNGDACPPPNKIKSRPSPSSDKSKSKSKSIKMKLLAPLDCVLDISKYTLTPRGYANSQIFSKSVPKIISDVHYISSFPERVQSAVNFLFRSDPNVSIYVLKTIRDLPCNVPIRWGVLFNLKFRRMFESLTIEKWTDISTVLKEFGYGIFKSGKFFLLDPNLNSLEDLPEIPSNQSPISSDDGSIFNSNSSLNFSFNSDSDFSVKYDSNPPPPSLTLTRPSVTRKSAYTIYSSSEVAGSLAAALADKFKPSQFSNQLLQDIRKLFNQNDLVIDNLFKKLELLPTNIPLRWGCIYNIHLRSRVRKKNPSDDNIPITKTTLDQWNSFKILLKAEGLLDDKSVKNCSILINK